MASSFGQYTQGIAPVQGISEAGARIGQMNQQGLASFGQNLAQGLQAYNDNSAKNDILTAEAEALGGQIQQYAQMFGNSPEHAEFAKSLQPYIEKLSKVPSMSLTQKMGTVTSVKAGFANIGQQLQVFELMRGERMKRDMNVARGGIKEYDEVTVPTAIIPSGKMPYFHDKSYTENEAEITRLATEAKGRGANVDISKVLSDWRSQFKASAMSRTDMPPEVKEALIKQIDAGENLVENIQTDDSGVTDYAKEAEMYGRTSTSVKEQLAPAKVEAPAQEDSSEYRTNLVDSINALRVATNGAKPELKQTIADQIAKLQKEISGIDKKSANKARAETTIKDAETQLVDVNAQIDALNKQVEEGDDPMTTRAGKIAQGIMKYGGKSAIELASATIKDSLINSDTPLTPEAIKNYVDKAANTTTGFAKSLYSGAAGLISPVQAYRQIAGRTITKNQEKAIDAEISKVLENDSLAIAKFTGDTEFQKEALNAKKVELENRIKTGVVNAKPSDIAKAQAPQAEAQPEPTYTLTNQRNMSLGTTTAQVASSIESKRNDMKTFFQNKYGYVPASFEESFKAIYPEANFKTMETPYGAFMHDGKDWKQIQMKEQKVMSRKEMAEEKAVSFGKLQSDSSIDINEFGELVPNSGIYVRGIFSGSPTDASKFRTQMLEGSNAKKAVGRLIEINDMVGESLPYNAKLWGEAKALLPQIKAGLRIDIIGVGTVSNYEQELINDVVADPTKFWSLESSDRAKLQVIMDKISNKLIQEPANHGLEVKVGGRTNAQREKEIRMGNLGAGKSKLQLDFEARGGKKGTSLNWDNTAKLPDAFKKALTD